MTALAPGLRTTLSCFAGRHLLGVDFDVRLEPMVRRWIAASRSVSQLVPARRVHPRRRPSLECLEARTVLSTITLTVNSLADDPSGPVPELTSLRDVITQANADTADQYVINFAVTGTIDLFSPLPALNNDISFDGPGASALTVQRDPTPLHSRYSLSTPM